LNKGAESITTTIHHCIILQCRNCISS
jgi:hypothetical protein